MCGVFHASTRFSRQIFTERFSRHFKTSPKIVLQEKSVQQQQSRSTRTDEAKSLFSTLQTRPKLLLHYMCLKHVNDSWRPCNSRTGRGCLPLGSECLPLRVNGLQCSVDASYRIKYCPCTSKLCVPRSKLVTVFTVNKITGKWKLKNQN